jgi:hypothetical protein
MAKTHPFHDTTQLLNIGIADNMHDASFLGRVGTNVA